MKVTDVLPGSLSFVSALPGQGDYNSNTGIWTVGSLANNGTAQLQIVAKVTRSGPVVNTAGVSASDQADSDTTNNTASVSLQASASEGESTSYQINASHTGFVAMPNFGPTLSMRWSVDLSRTLDYPLVAQNRVFVTTRGTTTDPLKLHAVDAATGNLAWTSNINFGTSYYRAGITYEGGKLFVLNDGYFWALEADTGNLIWSKRIPGNQTFSDGPPVAFNGNVFNIGNASGGVNSLKESDGTLFWSTANSNSYERGVAAGCHQRWRIRGKRLHLQIKPDNRGGYLDLRRQL